MKIKNGFELRDVCGEKVIIAQGLENLDFSKMINLNESAAFLWKASAEMDSFTEEELVHLLCEEYEVNQDIAAKDIHSMIEEWKSLGLVSAE